MCARTMPASAIDEYLDGLPAFLDAGRPLLADLVRLRRQEISS